jgi:valyl-tRNA synthetase
MHAAYPSDLSAARTGNRDPVAEATMDIITGVISGIRNVRGEMNLSPSLPLAVVVQTDAEAVEKAIVRHRNMIVNLARLSSIAVEKMGKRPASAATAVIDDATIFVLLEGIIDVTVEVQRLEKEIDKLTDEMSTLAKKLNNEDFLTKAPAEVVEKVKERHGNLLEKQARLQSNLQKIKAVSA